MKWGDAALHAWRDAATERFPQCTSAQTEDTAIGAGVGGVAGAVLTGGSAVGTVGGAVVGGVVGNQIKR